MTEEQRVSSFDAVAKGLASGTVSRGKAFRLMGAALVGGTLASVGLGGVAAADDLCKPTGKKCKKNSQCCSGNCDSTTGKCCTPSGRPCSEGLPCCSGYCACGMCAQLPV
jgi:hypothetical protein